MFEVYLFELKSVTIATTQGIVRAFRNRPGDYLLVLTDDYQRLDFVLVERYTSYYLTTRLPDSPEWKNATEAAAMTRAFRELRELYADVRETFSNQPEEVIRTRLLEPVLATLGFVAQPVKASNSDMPEPHYRLYPVSAAGYAIEKPLALCLAYTWGRNLDGKDEQRDELTPDENPGAVVVTLLDSGEADWAIVTKGKTWRLYSAKAHSRATNYYEIDLEETLPQAPAHLEYAFRYFWLFFRSAAFIPTDKGACWLLLAQPLMKLEERASRLTAYPEALEATRLLITAYSESQSSAAGSLYLAIENLENASGGERGLIDLIGQSSTYVKHLKHSLQPNRHAKPWGQTKLAHQQCLERATDIIKQYITLREQSSN
jgi:hypothetical protein